ncbi:PaaI family thioesterase [Reyranella sp. CPCC 100927]|uniref:PaaI family thioesterase n=1 Tax=Reyranella sp. CPCC 100927 TaxID=2599616 RepID=UPI002106DC09|nr:PaaI family thioesterase [Reyranella sp. CPCC 100927]
MPLMGGPELLQFLDTSFPQSKHLGLQVEHIDAQSIRLRMPTGEQHLRPGGIVSGPTLMWLADCGAYLLILAQIGPVAMAVTSSLNMNFLRAGEGGRDLIGQGRLLKLGRRLAVTDFTILSDGTAAPIAQATVTYAIPTPPRNGVK